MLLGVFLLLGGVASGHLYSIDGLQYFRAGERLLLNKSWLFDPPLLWGGPIQVPITPIGLSLAYWPALVLSLPLQPLQPHFGAVPFDQTLLYGDPVYVVSSWVNPLVAAITVLGTSALALRLGLGRLSAIVVGLTALFAGPLLFYARADFPQPLSGALLVTVLYLAVRVRQGEAARGGLILLSISAAILTRPVDGSIAAAASVVVLATPTAAWAPVARSWRFLGEVGGGVLTGALLTLVVNAARRGSFLDFGPGPAQFIGSLRFGLLAEIASPGRGLLWYLPLTVLALVGAAILWRSHQRALLLGLVFPIAAYLLVYAKWASLGAWSWGPRYLVPVTPLVVLLAGMPLLLERPSAGRIAFAGLALLGGLENLAHIGVDQLQGFWGTYGDDYFGTPGYWKQFDLGAFAPVSSWTSFTRTPDVLWFRLISVTGGLSLLVCFALLVAAGVCITLALRTAQRDARPG